MTRTTRPIAAVALIAVVAGLLGCSGPGNGEATVLPLTIGCCDGGHATTIDTVDIGVPLGRNVTGFSVRLEHVSLVPASSAVHLDAVFTYPPGPGIGLVSGNLIKGCPHYKAYPVTAAVARPHAQMRWNLVIALTFVKPGRYDVRRVKISYLTDGHSGWQYQAVNTTIDVRAARAGAKPRFSGCL
jgi:hypothetical protein